jgi:hypothetical protein
LTKNIIGFVIFASMEAQIIKTKDSLKTELDSLQDEFGEPEYYTEKHKLLWETDESTVSLRLPYDLMLDQDHQPLWDYRFHSLTVIVRTSMATVGLFYGDECLSHKVFSAYMVRKKQGVSQIKHLKTKGKSRAGSRIRLASGVEFFEGINGRLQDHFEAHNIERIAFSCSKILLPHFFGAKVPTPFDKKDARILGIPRHVEKPTHEEMMRTQRFLNYAELSRIEHYL